MISSCDIVAKKILRAIESRLSAAGFFFRAFYRVKTKKSLDNKIARSPEKYSNNKKIQDIIGIRICLYFPDDISIAKEILSDAFELSSEAIDDKKSSTFAPERYNLVYKIPPGDDLGELLNTHTRVIDNTFEVQIRTMLSEGWHEIEHDLRYKHKSDWGDRYAKLDRMFNGVFAALETAEWTMLKLFEDKAHAHYKQSELEEMMRYKFRLRFADTNLSDTVKNIITDHNMLKPLLRSDRDAIIKFLAYSRLPTTMDNIVYAFIKLGHQENFYKFLPEFIKST